MAIGSHALIILSVGLHPTHPSPTPETFAKRLKMCTSLPPRVAYTQPKPYPLSAAATLQAPEGKVWKTKIPI